MTKKFGPFVRASADDKWHWMKQCSQFPGTTHPEAMISSKFPEKEFLCMECYEIDKLNMPEYGILTGTRKKQGNL
jgi:hypothetical protein